jgi:integrase
VWRRREQAPKTLNAIRLVDIPESLAQVLCRYITGRKGHLFTTRAGRLLDSRNVLDVLQRAGRQGGHHAFRRFRFAVLHKAGVPDDLIKLWLGHSQNLIDLLRADRRSPWNRIVAHSSNPGRRVVKDASRAPRESAFCWQFA